MRGKQLAFDLRARIVNLHSPSEMILSAPLDESGTWQLVDCRFFGLHLLWIGDLISEQELAQETLDMMSLLEFESTFSKHASYNEASATTFTAALGPTDIRVNTHPEESARNLRAIREHMPLTAARSVAQASVVDDAGREHPLSIGEHHASDYPSGEGTDHVDGRQNNLSDSSSILRFLGKGLGGAFRARNRVFYIPCGYLLGMRDIASDNIHGCRLFEAPNEGGALVKAAEPARQITTVTDVKCPSLMAHLRRNPNATLRPDAFTSGVKALFAAVAKAASAAAVAEAASAAAAGCDD